MLNAWRQRQIYNADQIVAAVKKLKEYNEDCEDLSCKEEKRDEENSLTRLCEKLSGELQSVGAETKAKLRDRRAALDSAVDEDEKKVIRRVYPNLPEKPDQLYGCVSSLAPREDKQAHGKGMITGDISYA